TCSFCQASRRISSVLLYTQRQQSSCVSSAVRWAGVGKSRYLKVLRIEQVYYAPTLDAKMCRDGDAFTTPLKQECPLRFFCSRSVEPQMRFNFWRVACEQ